MSIRKIRRKGINNIVSLFFAVFLMVFSTSQTGAYATETPPLESTDDSQVTSENFPASKDNNTDFELNDLKEKDSGTSKASGMGAPMTIC